MSDSKLEPERMCPICGTKMMVEHLHPPNIIYHNIGAIQRVSKEQKTIGFNVISYVCPSCGKVVLWLSDNQLKEHQIKEN